MSQFDEKQKLSKEEIEKLVRDNINLVRHIVLKKFKIPYYEADIPMSDGLLGLYKAACTFDTQKGIKFSTYASICITNEINMTNRREKRHKGIRSLSEPVYEGDDGSALLLEESIAYDETIYEALEGRDKLESVVNIILNYLEGTTRLSFLYFLSGMNQKEIANILDISQSYVSRLVSKTQKKLRAYIDKNSICYREVYKMSIPNERFYQFSFSTVELTKFNQLFANLLASSDPKEIPNFKLLHNKNRIHLFLNSDPESFAFIASIIREVEKFELSYKADTEEHEQNEESTEIVLKVQQSHEEDAEEGEEEHKEIEEITEQAEEQETQETNPVQQNKSVTLRGTDTITQKLLEFILSKKSFSVSEISQQFSECKSSMIQYVLRKAKNANLIVNVGKGRYEVIEN